MLEEYDFSKDRRGRDTVRYAQGTKIVLLDPDVATQFPDSAHVNEALRRLLKKSPGARAKERRVVTKQPGLDSRHARASAAQGIW